MIVFFYVNNQVQFLNITSRPLQPHETDMNDLKCFHSSKAGTTRNTQTPFPQKLNLKGRMQRKKKLNWKRQLRQETEKRESGGLELDEGCISSHWVGNSEKSPWLLKKRKKSKAENSYRGMGAVKQACPPLHCFFPFAVVGVVGHSVLEEGCMTASRLAKPVSMRIWKRIGGDKA